MTPRIEFFEVTAQLLPVFFLALLLEDRLHPDQHPGQLSTRRSRSLWTARSQVERLLRTAYLCILAAAEITCLFIVASGKPSHDAWAIVMGAFVITIVYFFIALVSTAKVSRREGLVHVMFVAVAAWFVAIMAAAIL